MKQFSIKQIFGKEYVPGPQPKKPALDKNVLTRLHYVFFAHCDAGDFDRNPLTFCLFGDGLGSCGTPMSTTGLWSGGRAKRWLRNLKRSVSSAPCSPRRRPRKARQLQNSHHPHVILLQMKTNGADNRANRKARRRNEKQRKKESAKRANFRGGVVKLAVGLRGGHPGSSDSGDDNNDDGAEDAEEEEDDDFVGPRMHPRK